MAIIYCTISQRWTFLVSRKNCVATTTMNNSVHSMNLLYGESRVMAFYSSVGLSVNYCTESW